MPALSPGAPRRGQGLPRGMLPALQDVQHHTQGEALGETKIALLIVEHLVVNHL